MGRKKQDSQNGTKRKITPGKILALVVGIIVAVYMSFSVRVFYGFIKLLLTDPDAGQKDVSVVTMIEDGWGEEPIP